VVSKKPSADEVGLSIKVVAHNLALLDALAEMSEAKNKITEDLGRVIKALVIKAGGEVRIDSAFISAAEDPDCVLNNKIGSDGVSVTLWVEKHEGDSK